MKKNSKPKSLPNTPLMIAISFIALVIFGFLLFYAPLKFIEHKVFQETRTEVESWGLPPNTILNEVRFQRIVLTTSCMVGVELIIDSQLPKESIEDFYLEHIFWTNLSIEPINNNGTDTIRYQIYIQMNEYVTWECI